MSFQQPSGFRPLLRDDTLPHQIRIIGQSSIAVSCVCMLRRDQANNPPGFAEAFPVRDAVRALDWYRTHLAEVDQRDVNYGTVSVDTSGGVT